MHDIDSIKIRPLISEDFNFVLKWSKDDEFCAANGWVKNRCEAELLHWWTSCVNQSLKDFIRMGIELNEKLIGYVDLAYIQGNTAELGIAIGDSKLWGQGLGSVAARAMMDHGYANWGITTFSAETHEKNIRSRRMLEKLGFTEISRIGTEEKLVQYRLSFLSLS